jgi:hypothetical protein
MPKRLKEDHCGNLSGFTASQQCNRVYFDPYQDSISEVEFTAVSPSEAEHKGKCLCVLV